MSQPFSPTRIRFDGFGLDDNESSWVRFRTPPPSTRTIAAPLAQLNVGSAELWSRFGDAGVVLSRDDQKALFEEVYRSGTARPVQFRVVNRIGWSSDRFVYPHNIFGGSARTVERNFGGLDLRKHRSSGALQQWQANIGKLCSGNSRLIFAVATAFAGPLLEILGFPNFGFSFVGEPSIGKTTLLMVAGSVMGCRVGASARRGFLESWATTPEGVERYGRAHNCLTLLLDETRLAGTDRQIGNLIAVFIMRLAEGVEKNRLVQAGGGDWQLVYLGTSNKSLPQLFAAAGTDFDDAYRVRFPDIFADAGCGYGVFENLHGFSNAAEFAKELQQRACTFFGSPMEQYLTRLSIDRSWRSEWLVSGLQKEMALYRGGMPSGSASDARITDDFAVVSAAAMLAQHYKILPLSRKEILCAIRSCERAHHQSVAQSHAMLDPVTIVKSYLTANLSRFRKVPDPGITDQEFSTAPGFLHVDHNGDLEYAVPQKNFARGVIPLNVGDVLRALDNAGLLVRGRDKYVSKIPIRSSATNGREWVYRIRSSIMDLKA